MPEGRFRLRIRYREMGRLRYLSHLEVLRAFGRIVRRAGLPYAITQGFSPHMKIAFGPALPVGTASLDEYLDLWLTTFVEPDEALARLRSASVPDLEPVLALYVPDDAPSLDAALSVASYRAVVATDALPGCDVAQRIADAVRALLAKGTIEVMKKKGRRTLDLSQMLFAPPCVESVDGDEATIVFATRSGESGALRPEVLLDAIAREAACELPVRSITRLSQMVFSDGTLKDVM